MGNRGSPPRTTVPLVHWRAVSANLSGCHCENREGFWHLRDGHKCPATHGTTPHEESPASRIQQRQHLLTQSVAFVTYETITLASQLSLGTHLPPGGHWLCLEISLLVTLEVVTSRGWGPSHTAQHPSVHRTAPSDRRSALRGVAGAEEPGHVDGPALGCS